MVFRALRIRSGAHLDVCPPALYGGEVSSRPPPLSTDAARLIAAADRAWRSGAAAEAREKAVAASEAAPGHRDTWLLRADIARSEGDMAELAMALGRAIELTDEPGQRLHFQIHRGWALHALGRIGETYVVARQIARAPVRADQGKYAGALLEVVGLSEVALPQMQAAAEAAPNDPGSFYDLALIHRAMGRTNDAAAAAERALALDPGLAQAHGLLALLKRWTAAENHVGRLQDALRAARTPLDRARIGYALFKELDDLGRSGDAWMALEEAGRSAAATFPWSAARERRALELMRAALPATAPPAAEAGAVRPVFIVGLPRSGTTLVERVLAAHSRVRALGELNAFGVLADPQPERKPWPYADLPAVERLAGVDWPSVGDAYREQVSLMAEGAAVVVDKNPQNWVFAGAIASALPEAVILHVARSPMDSLFGACKQLFLREHAWSYAQADLAAHYAHYRQMTAHWRHNLGERFIDVSYDDLARDPQTWAPRIVEAAGLEMEPACLSPESAAGGVRTLSSIQVREPINTRSIGGWRRYGAQLEPLRAALEAQGAVDHDGEAMGRG
jgi:tetratricopeptide (TPR) repeat protein